MADHLRRNDLVLLDRGFYSYGLWWRIQSRGAYFAIRLKKQIRLQTLRRLGDKDCLVRWKPKDTRGKWKKEGWPPSIDLRLIRYQVRGFRATALLTNMLNAQKAPREDWVRLTTACEAGRPLQPGLYHRRWEIETTFFELKVTQGMEGSLRSRTPDGIEYEIAGHVLLYLLVRWLMVEAAVEHAVDPLRLSFVEAWRELQSMQIALLMASPGWAARVLLPRLLQRIAAHVVPYRPGRSFPRPKMAKSKIAGMDKNNARQNSNEFKVSTIGLAPAERRLPATLHAKLADQSSPRRDEPNGTNLESGAKIGSLQHWGSSESESSSAPRFRRSCKPWL